MQEKQKEDVFLSYHMPRIMGALYIAFDLCFMAHQYYFTHFEPHQFQSGSVLWITT